MQMTAPPPDLEPPAWMRAAACVGAPDTTLWFPERGQSSAAAKAICRTCPVMGECLEYALGLGELFGIWGGTSGRERKRMLRQRRRAA